MTNNDIDSVMAACSAWVEQHHRTKLTVQESGAIRVRLKVRLHSPMQAKPEERELVEIAHRLANEVVAKRRDAAQRAEHHRVAR
jgi:hypothetical protein